MAQVPALGFLFFPSLFPFRDLPLLPLLLPLRLWEHGLGETLELGPPEQPGFGIEQGNETGEGEDEIISLAGRESRPM